MRIVLKNLKKNRASHEFNLENYLVNYEKEESKNILICNKILKNK